jgi:hypothetical protein
MHSGHVFCADREKALNQKKIEMNFGQVLECADDTDDVMANDDAQAPQLKMAWCKPCMKRCNVQKASRNRICCCHC